MLKKNNVAADVVSMGETDQNQARRSGFICLFVFGWAACRRTPHPFPCLPPLSGFSNLFRRRRWRSTGCSLIPPSSVQPARCGTLGASGDVCICRRIYLMLRTSFAIFKYVLSFLFTPPHPNKTKERPALPDTQTIPITPPFAPYPTGEAGRVHRRRQLWRQLPPRHHPGGRPPLGRAHFVPHRQRRGGRRRRRRRRWWPGGRWGWRVRRSRGLRR